MKTIGLITLLPLAISSALTIEPAANNVPAVAEAHRSHVERLRTRSILQARDECSVTDCMEGGDTACHDAGCSKCAWDYYCITYDDAANTPPIEQLPIFASASEVAKKPSILTNFVEPSQFKDHWAAIICNEITKVASNQDKTGGKWHFGIQGTHKEAISLVHEGRYLDILVTWEPSDTRVLPMFEKDKLAMCKKALEMAADNTHQLQYGAFNTKAVLSVKNRHAISIQTPKSPRGSGKTKRGRTGNTIAFINIELGDHSKEVGLFNGNGLPS